jgi:hypothetical protein
LSKTKVRKASKHLPRLRREFKKIKLLQVKAEVEEFKEMIETLYSITFQFWQGGSNPRESRSAARTKYPVPQVEFSEPEITISNDFKINVKIDSWVIDPSTGKHHELWYWLDFGTKTIIWNSPYPSASFPMRVVSRTQPGTLKVRPAPAYGERRRIFPGQLRKGIEPRRWSEAVALQLGKELPKTELGKTGWKVSKFSTRKP